MRLTIVGEDAPGALANSYVRAFGELGWDCNLICLRRLFLDLGQIARNRVSARLFEWNLLKRLNHSLIDIVRATSPDLIFVIKGEQLSGETIIDLKRRTNSRIINFYPDDPFSDERSNRLCFGVSVLASYDACFIFARHLMNDYVRSGCQSVHYLPFARDPILHYPPPNTPAPDFDVVFVGNLDSERVRWLEPLAHLRLAVFGEVTSRALGKGSKLRSATLLPAAYGEELARALARGAVSVNIMRLQNRLSHNMRSFESPSCGAFTASQWTPELADLFVEGKEVVFATSPEALAGVVDKWLRDPAGRARIAAGGYRRVQADTYMKRAKQILETLENSSC